MIKLVVINIIIAKGKIGAAIANNTFNAITKFDYFQKSL